MKLRSIGTKLATAFMGAVALVILVAAVSLLESAAFSKAALEIKRSYSGLSAEALPMVRSAQAMKLNVAEVQQFLSDLSATRGLDGLDDGPKRAEENAALFRSNAVALNDIAARKQNSELIEAIHGATDNFEPYYQAGKAMAAAYVAEGPTGGNKLMGDFDEKAAALLGWLDKVLAVVDADVARGSADTGSIIATAAERARYAEFLTLAIAAVAVVLALAIGFLLHKSVPVPIGRLSSRLHALGEGRTEDPMPYTERHDEIGDMARAAGIFRDAMVARLNLREDARSERDKERLRQTHIDEVVKTFRLKVAEVLGSVNHCMRVMHLSAERLAGVAQPAGPAAPSAEAGPATGSIESVATAAQELAASAREIASQTGLASATAADATAAAMKTDTEVSSLVEAAEKIGTIVDLIRSVAAQTNLLALNATIEAQRAGDRGKGFAVVASEVKTLAGQTRQATDEIAAKISAIQGSTETAVAAIRSITRTVAEINHVTTAIASAVDGQHSATTGIARAALLASSEATSVREVSETAVNTVATMAIVVEQFLRDVAKDVEDRRAALRVQTKEIVQVISSTAETFALEMRDVSETGCQLAAFEGAAVGGKITINFPDVCGVQATIVRLAKGQMGVQFAERQAQLKWLAAA
jgi:methyl-accepting chemotaxis protein